MSTSTHITKELRKHRTRTRLALHQEKPRLSVHRSLRHIFAQIIDDTKGKTIAHCSDISLKATGTKSERASLVGKQIAELAKTNKVTEVRFDRGACKYHGRIAALANAARENGLTF